MRYLDFFNDIHKRWATKREVMRICGCSETEAYEILMQLKMEAKERGLYMPNMKNDIYVPMQLFLNFLGNDRVNRINRYHNCLIDFGY